jgi:hypothetical protein
VNTIKLDNIEKIAQGRIDAGGYSPNPIQDMRVACKWLVELVQEVRRLDAQRRVYRLRVNALHKLIKDIPENPDTRYSDDWEVGHMTGEAQLARKVRKLLGTDDD